MKFLTAHDVIKHLYSLPHLHPKNDLSFIKRILSSLGDPQNKVKTIHVTGTNGKGSTSYYLSNLLQKAGQKTGLFVSPYIREFNERIQLNGQDIPNSDLVNVANIVESKIELLQKDDPNFALVTFEYETALAFEYFYLNRCDYAVIEVGIGGQHDKTNVICPEVSVITTTGLDHEKIIGPTIEDIAHEKSGIIKSKKPVVLGNVPQTVLPILLKKANETKSSVYLLGRDYTVETAKNIQYCFKNHQIVFAKRPLVESYDIAIAVTAFYLLHLPLEEKMIEKAIDQTNIPGRYQIISKAPKIVLDGAHNIQAMNNLLSFLHQVKNKDGHLYCLVTMMKDKDLKQVFDLFEDQDKVTLTTVPYPRAAKLNDFPAEVREKYAYDANYCHAYQNLKNKLSKNDILLVTGSFYLVSAILQVEDPINASARD